MVKYKCNFCGKADIPTQAGLKVHIQLSKAGCREAMETQTNRSLSPDLETDLEVAEGLTRCVSTQPPSNFDNVPIDMSFNDISLFVPPRHVDKSVEPEPVGYRHQSKQARVEEVEDEEAYPRYAKEFPIPAEELGDAKMVFEVIFDDQRAKQESPWAPFADKEEWELARWLAKNVNQ
jgi:hypothetical protein